MDRRELLKMIAFATGTAFIGGEFFLAGCKSPDSEAGASVEFSPDDVALLDEVGETILPRTDSPGAKDAKIGAFMALMVNDCYTKANQKTFHAGLSQLDKACRDMHDTTFMKASPEQRKALLEKLDADAKSHAKKKNDFDAEQVKMEREAHDKGNSAYKREEMSDHYFSMMKQLTILGYYTSKEGREGALRYTPVPGKQVADLDYKKGDKAFAGLN